MVVDSKCYGLTPRIYLGGGAGNAHHSISGVVDAKNNEGELQIVQRNRKKTMLLYFIAALLPFTLS